MLTGMSTYNPLPALSSELVLWCKVTRRLSVNEDLNVHGYISAKIFNKIRSEVIIWSGGVLLSFGGGLCYSKDFKHLIQTSLSNDKSLVKFS